jgi:hypothetical protein
MPSCPDRSSTAAAPVLKKSRRLLWISAPRQEHAQAPPAPECRRAAVGGSLCIAVPPGSRSDARANK